MFKLLLAVTSFTASLSEFYAPEPSNKWGLIVYFIIGALLAIVVTLVLLLSREHRRYLVSVSNCHRIKEEISAHRLVCHNVSRWVCSLLGDLTSDFALSSHHNELLISKIQKRFSAASGKNECISKCVVSLADISYNGISQRLKEKFPKLSVTDIEICSLILLDFPPNGIQYIYRHTNNQSYYNFRKRLRSKMNINHDISIKDFLIGIAGVKEESDGK